MTDSFLVAVVGSLIGFIGGLITFFVSAYYQRMRERQALASLFIEHIRSGWTDVETLKTAPVGDYVHRLKFQFYGVQNLNITGEVEYEFEVDNVKLYQTHGMQLATLASKKTRRQIWKCYELLRKVENVRVLIKGMPKGHPDKLEYMKIFSELITRYAKELNELERLLINDNKCSFKKILNNC